MNFRQNAKRSGQSRAVEGRRGHRSARHQPWPYLAAARMAASRGLCIALRHPRGIMYLILGLGCWWHGFSRRKLRRRQIGRAAGGESRRRRQSMIKRWRMNAATAKRKLIHRRRGVAIKQVVSDKLEIASPRGIKIEATKIRPASSRVNRAMVIKYRDAFERQH